MTVHMIGVPRMPQLFAPRVQLADQQQAAASKNEALSERDAVDDYSPSLAQPGDSQVVDQSRSLSVLNFKSKLKVKQADDGAIAIKYKSQLKFNYEFQSEDGTTVRLAAKVKTKISHEQSGEGSFEFKTRVKFQLSVVQETVQSGLAPALESDGATDEQRSTISAAIRGFGDLVEQLGSQFQDESIGGDDLIANIVNAFNDLTRSAQSELRGQTEPQPVPIEEPSTDVAPEVIDVSSEVSDDATPSVAVVDPDVSPVEIPSIEDEPQSDFGGTPNADQSTSQPTDGAQVIGDGESVDSDIDDPLQVVTNSAEAELPAASSSYTDESVFINLRVSFVESISQLVSVLDDPSGASDASGINSTIWTRTKLDFRLTARSQTQTWGENLPGTHVDADA